MVGWLDEPSAIGTDPRFHLKTHYDFPHYMFRGSTWSHPTPPLLDMFEDKTSANVLEEFLL